METEGSRLTAPCVWVGGCLSHGWEDMGGAVWAQRCLWDVGRQLCACIWAGGRVQTPW